MNTFEVFPWNKNFETLIGDVDDQHKILVRLINTLALNVAYQSDLPTLNAIFTELFDYANLHFKTEEEIWDHYLLKTDPWVVSHKRAHASFLKEVAQMKDRESSISVEKGIESVLAFLTHWLAFHILETDKRMAIAISEVKQGKDIESAKLLADQKLSGAMKVLVETILTMYDELSVRTLQLMKEIIERQKMEAKLRLAGNAIEHTLEGICITDSDFKIIEVNPAFYQTTYYSQEEVMGKSLKQIKTGFNDGKLNARVDDALKKTGHWSGEISSRNKKEELDTEWLTLSAIRNENAEITNYVALFSNISHLIQQRSKLEMSANYDMLTGLPNRHLLSDRLDLAVKHAQKNNTFLALCYLDLDGFKEVNDVMGHATGDHVLWEIAQRFTKTVPEDDTVLRLGGDEFIIILGDLKNDQDCLLVLDQLLREVERPIFFQDSKAKVTASIGITVFPQAGVEKGDLLHLSDQAMYQAKKLGKSRYQFYKSSE